MTLKVHLHPLAYLLGIEGAALLRSLRDGTADRNFVAARLAEIRELLADAELAGAAGVDAELGGLSVVDVYREWASVYDRPGNQMIDLKQPVVHEILAGLHAGDALDAACGTGRHTAELVRLGHRVVGVDTALDMLAVARARLPGSISGWVNSPDCRCPKPAWMLWFARWLWFTFLTWPRSWLNFAGCFDLADIW